MRIYIILLLLVTAMGLPRMVMAEEAQKKQVCENDPTRECIQLPNPLIGGRLETTELIGVLIKGALGIIGSLAVLMIIWGGSTWLLSAGNADKIKIGTETMIWAVVGVLVVFISYVFLSNILDFLTGKR